MNEQILQKIRHAYESSNLGEWKLFKTQDGQLMIMNGKTVIAVVNRLEDAVFIENVHRYFPGLMVSTRDTAAAQPQPKTVQQVNTEQQKRGVGRPRVHPKPPEPSPTPAKPAEPPKPKIEEKNKQPQVLKPVVKLVDVDIPTLVVPKAGSLQDLTA